MTTKNRIHTDEELLRMALVGFSAERRRIDEDIAQIREALNKLAVERMRRLPGLEMAQEAEARRVKESAEKAGKGPRRRKMGIGARKAIAEAQRRRWKEWRQAKARVLAGRRAA